MIKLFCLIFIFQITSMTYGQGRSPAVEDFVGMEFEEKQVAPQGTESLFNLEQDLNKMEAQKTQGQPSIQFHTANSGLSTSHVVTLLFLVSMPFLVWLMIMGHLKKKAGFESASNIKVLEKYRRDKENGEEEKIKKVS